MNRRLWTSLFVVALLVVSRQPAHAQFTEPTLLYDFSTGNVKFFVPPVIGLRVFSTEQLLIPDVGNDMGFQVTEKTAYLYSWFSIMRISAPVLDAGNIVQPVEYSRRFHLQADVVFHGSSSITRLEIVYVPEPPTLLLAAASFAVAGVYRLSRGRRRKADDSMTVGSSRLVS